MKKYRCRIVSYFMTKLIKGTIGNLSKLRRQREREHYQTKGLMSRTIALHVGFESWYISWPFSAKQQREMKRVLENVNDDG